MGIFLFVEMLYFSLIYVSVFLQSFFRINFSYSVKIVCQENARGVFFPASIKFDCHLQYIYLYSTECLPLGFDSAACYLDTNCNLNRINTGLKTALYIIPVDAFIIKLTERLDRIAL